jgi:hypothetical protein
MTENPLSLVPYLVIRNAEFARFIAEVNAFILAGQYVPIGNVSFINGEYHQSMLLHEYLTVAGGGVSPKSQT